MKYNSKVLWESFKSFLACELKNVEYNELEKVLPYETERTRFYKEKLFPAIAARLCLRYENKEWWKKVDAIFYEESEEVYNYRIPIVFIESENKIDNIQDNELYDLCFLNSPLKIIFTWEEGGWVEKKKKYKEMGDEDWSFAWREYVMKSFVRVSRLVGYCGIVVAEKKNEKFVFHTFAFDENAEITDEEKILVEI